LAGFTWHDLALVTPSEDLSATGTRKIKLVEVFAFEEFNILDVDILEVENKQEQAFALWLSEA
jgi:hypothetical protein